MAPYSEEYLMGEKKDQGELHKASWVFKVTNVLVVALNIVVSFAAIPGIKVFILVCNIFSTFWSAG